MQAIFPRTERMMTNTKLKTVTWAQVLLYMCFDIFRRINEVI